MGDGREHKEQATGGKWKSRWRPGKADSGSHAKEFVDRTLKVMKGLNPKAVRHGLGICVL